MMCTDYAINLTTDDPGFGRYSGFLADKEIRILLDELATGAEGVPEILVTLDSCHSGGGSRDPRFPLVRTAAVDEAASARPLANYYLGRLKGQITADTRKLPDPPHTILTACDNHELAAERSGGLFTTALINVLESVPGPGILSYADLLIRLRGAVRKQNVKQTPQFETFGGRKAYRSFLQGFAQGNPDLYEVSFRHDKWVVGLGAIHGLPTTAAMQRIATARSQPLELEIYLLGAAIGSGTTNLASVRSGEVTNIQPASNNLSEPTTPGLIDDLGPQHSTLEFRRSNFGIKLHLVDFLPGTNDKSLEGALVRKVSDKYSAIEFRQANFGLKMEIFADDAKPTEGPIHLQGVGSQIGPGMPKQPITEPAIPQPPAVVPQAVATEPLGVARILEVGPFFSTIDLPAVIRRRADTSYYAVLNYLPVQPETVLVRGPEEAAF